MWNWKFFLIFAALRINGDLLARLYDIRAHRPENAPVWMSTRSGSLVLLALVFLCIGGQIATVICQFFWFRWYNVIITDVTAFVAALIFYTVFLYRLGGWVWLLSICFWAQHLSLPWFEETPGAPRPLRRRVVSGGLAE
jgi:hypothetical protein